MADRQCPSGTCRTPSPTRRMGPPLYASSPKTPPPPDHSYDQYDYEDDSSTVNSSWSQYGSTALAQYPSSSSAASATDVMTPSPPPRRPDFDSTPSLCPTPSVSSAPSSIAPSPPSATKRRLVEVSESGPSPEEWERMRQDVLAKATGSNYVIIEEEVVEQFPAGAGPGAQPSVIKRIRRQITKRLSRGPGFFKTLTLGRGRGRGKGKQGRRADEEGEQPCAPDDACEQPECPRDGDGGGPSAHALWTGDRYEWDKRVALPRWVQELQRGDPVAYGTCAMVFAQEGRWPTPEELGPDPDAVPGPQGGFTLREGRPLPPWVQDARRRGDAAFADAMQHYATWGRWPRR